jgi:hypothetical protein
MKYALIRKGIKEDLFIMTAKEAKSLEAKLKKIAPSLTVEISKYQGWSVDEVVRESQLIADNRKD